LRGCDASPATAQATQQNVQNQEYRLELYRMSENNISIQAASTRDISEVVRLFNAYRDFYGEAPDESRALSFIHDRITLACAQPSGQFSVAQYFLAWMQTAQGRGAVGFMHLMPSTNTLAMRPIWFLEDLYVDPSARRKGVATAFLRHAEQFARSTGAERLTLATAHDNVAAQGVYRKLGYVREEHFWVFHRLLP
jgi:ribosomal protein S18 acetylase RimI-like enzyme